jgi:hypothetical protein
MQFVKITLACTCTSFSVAFHAEHACNRQGCVQQQTTKATTQSQACTQGGMHLKIEILEVASNKQKHLWTHHLSFLKAMCAALLECLVVDGKSSQNSPGAQARLLTVCLLWRAYHNAMDHIEMLMVLCTEMWSEKTTRQRTWKILILRRCNLPEASRGLNSSLAASTAGRTCASGCFLFHLLLRIFAVMAG